MARNKWLIYGIPAALLAVIFLRVLMREDEVSFSAQPAPAQNKVVIVPTDAPKKATKKEDAERVQRIDNMRARFKASVDYSANFVVPARGPDKAFNFAVNYQPIKLGCEGGDLDLIKKALPDKGTALLLTVDSDGDRKALHEKRLTFDALSQPFSLSLKIPAPERAKVYRLTLCSDRRGQTSCKSAIPAPMDKIGTNKAAAELKQNLIFYAQTFVVDASGIQFLSNLRQDLASKAPKPTAFGSHLADSAYLKQLPLLNAAVKPLPTSFAANALSFGLTYRDIAACKALGGGR